MNKRVPIECRGWIDVSDYPELDDCLIRASDAMDAEDRAKRRLEEAKETTRLALANVRDLLGNGLTFLEDGERQALLSHVYWSDPKFAGPVKDAWGWRFAPDPREYRLICRSCGNESFAVALSWTELNTQSTCEACRHFQEVERALFWSQRESESKAKLDTIRQLRSMPYPEYLQSAWWQFRREQTLKSDGYRCRLCNSASTLNVHHRTYERRGEEQDSDLITLCRGCHAKFHNKL